MKRLLNAFEDTFRMVSKTFNGSDQETAKFMVRTMAKQMDMDLFLKVTRRTLHETEMLRSSINNYNQEIHEEFLKQLTGMPDECKKVIVKQIGDPMDYSTGHLKRLMVQKYITWKTGQTRFDKNMFIYKRPIKSITKLIRTVDVLVDKYKYLEYKGNDDIYWSFLLEISPDVLEQFLEEMPTVAGFSVTQLALSYPLVLRVKSVDVLARKLDLLAEYGIEENQIQGHMPTLTLGAKTLRLLFN